MSSSAFEAVIEAVGRAGIPTITGYAPGLARCRVGLGPFPARLRTGRHPRPDLADRTVLLLEIVAGEVRTKQNLVAAWERVPVRAIDEGLAGGPLAPPGLQFEMVAPARVQLTACLETDQPDIADVQRLVGDAATSAALLARELLPDLLPGWVAACGRHGIAAGSPVNIMALLVSAERPVDVGFLD